MPSEPQAACVVATIPRDPRQSLHSARPVLPRTASVLTSLPEPQYRRQAQHIPRYQILAGAQAPVSGGRCPGTDMTAQKISSVCLPRDQIHSRMFEATVYEISGLVEIVQPGRMCYFPTYAKENTNVTGDCNLF
jgi:hypothetical protein